MPQPIRKPVELAAEQALGRELHFAGSQSLIPTPRPTLEMQDVTIANPAEPKFVPKQKWSEAPAVPPREVDGK